MQSKPALTQGLTKALSESSDDSIFGFKKWQLVLLIGSPILVGFAYYFYTNRNKSFLKKKSTPKKSEKDVPKTPESIALQLKVKGNECFGKGQYTESIMYYSQAIDKCPINDVKNLAAYYQNRAAAYSALKDYEKAIQDCSKAIQLDKHYIKALLRRARAFEEINKIQDALNDIAVVNALEYFRNNSNLLMYERLIQQLTKIRVKELKKPSHKFPSANNIREFFKSFSRDPLFKGQLVDEQVLTEKLKSLETQEVNGEKVIEKILLIRGNIEMLLQNADKAMEYFNQVLQQENVDDDIKVNALLKLATIKSSASDSNSPSEMNEILKHFDDAIAVDPGNADIYLHRAQIFMNNEVFSSARSDLHKASESDPNFVTAVAQRLYADHRYAAIANDMAECDQILQSFEEMIEKFPKCCEMYSLFAQALNERNDKRAEKLLLKAIEIDPDDPNNYVHLGVILISSDIERAIELMNKALEKDKSSQFAYEMLGNIEMQRGNVRKALNIFSEGIEHATSEKAAASLVRVLVAAETQVYISSFLGINFQELN